MKKIPLTVAILLAVGCSHKNTTAPPSHTIEYRIPSGWVVDSISNIVYLNELGDPIQVPTQKKVGGWSHKFVTNKTYLELFCQAKICISSGSVEKELDLLIDDQVVKKDKKMGSVFQLLVSDTLS